MSTRSYWTYLGWQEKVSVVEPGEAHSGEDLEEPAGYQVHAPVVEVLQGTDGVVAGHQDQVIQNSIPDEH